MTGTGADRREVGVGTDGPAVALFVPDGDAMVPTGLARGPWSPDALHGGPVAALVARTAERHAAGSDARQQLVRITLELLRPVPMAPLTVTSSLVKPGRRVQLLAITATAGDVEVATARALLLRVAPEEPAVPPATPEERRPPGPGDAGAGPPVHDEYTAFHNRGVEMRFAYGFTDGRGPATVWFRLRCPVVAGEEPTPWQRAAAAADFGNGISSEIDFLTTSFVNADLTVSVHRPAVGEWVCLDARTRFGSPGIGAAESALWDEEGRIGRAIQHLVVEARR